MGVMTGDLAHFVLGEHPAHVAHFLVRPLAAAKRLDLVEKVKLLLAGEMRHVGASGDPVSPVTGRALDDHIAEIGLFPGESWRGGEQEKKDNPFHLGFFRKGRTHSLIREDAPPLHAGRLAPGIWMRMRALPLHTRVNLV